MSADASPETIPDGWECLSLSDVCLNVSKIDPLDLGRKEFKYIDIGSIDSSTNSVTSPQMLNVDDAPGRARQLVRSGDSVFSTVRPYLRKIAYVDENLDSEIASTGFCVIRPNPSKVLPRFIRFFSISDNLMEQVLPLQRGVSYPAVRDKEVLSTRILVPSLSEQERIVEILEEQLSRLDAALASVNAVREKSARFRRSLLHAAFTGALAGHDVSDETLPAGWVKGTIGHVADVVGGRTPTKFEQRLESSPTVNRSVPFYKVGDMNSAVRYLSESRVYFAESETGLFGIEILPSGTVIFPKAGGAIATNKKRILDVPGAIDLNCMGLKPNGELLPKLLYWFFESFNLSSIADGSVLPQIGKKKVAGIVICYPVNLVEQQKLLDEIEASISKSDEADLIAESIEKKSSALRRSLLHAAFTGVLTKEWREGAHV